MNNSAKIRTGSDQRCSPFRQGYCIICNLCTLHDRPVDREPDFQYMEFINISHELKVSFLNDHLGARQLFAR